MFVDSTNFIRPVCSLQNFDASAACTVCATTGRARVRRVRYVPLFLYFSSKLNYSLPTHRFMVFCFVLPDALWNRFKAIRPYISWFHSVPLFRTFRIPCYCVFYRLRFGRNRLSTRACKLDLNFSPHSVFAATKSQRAISTPAYLLSCVI